MPVVRTGKQAKKSHVSLDASLLDPALLQDEIAIENALCILEGHLINPTVDRESLLNDLLQEKNLFEFVFAGMGGDGANVIEEHIGSAFPITALEFEDSLASVLLERWSEYFWHLNLPSLDLAEQHSLAQLIRPALKALTNLNLPSEPNSPVVEKIENDFKSPPVTKRTKQREWKKKRAATQAVTLDAKLFTKLNVDPPTSAEEVARLEAQLLGDLNDILMHYLQVLRNRRLTPQFKAAYLTRPKDTTPIPGNAVTTSSPEEPTGVAESTTHQPHAFPNVQPMKAALYFDSAEGFGDWHIIISTRADKDLRKANRADGKRFQIYLKKIRELSNGHFSEDNQKPLAGSYNDIPIFEAKMTGDSRLVYQIDCIKEFGEEIERQVIRVFGIYTHSQLERDFWTTVSKHISGKGKEYKRRCLYRTKPTNTPDKVYLPATFPLNSGNDVSSTPRGLSDSRVEDKQDLHSLLVLEKFVTFSQALLNSILANQDAAHVFHMSPVEQSIVLHAGSCYVRGRSGTGKTTTMLFKMLGIEQAHEIIRAQPGDESPRPRQLFVTQSRVLAEKVQEYYSKLAMSQSAAHQTPEELAKLAAEQRDSEKQVLVDKDEEELRHGTLPRSFNDLKDEHFPLFITFDQLCRLLEGGNSQSSAPDGAVPSELQETKPVGGSATASDYMLQQRASFVSYITFLTEYWPRLPSHYTRSLDPALVFAELIGIIKGSEESVATEKGYIDEETYMNVSRRQQGTFTSQRDVVYRIFEEYLKLKKARAEWDAADRVHKILHHIRDFDVPGLKVDFVYVDEVQDNLMIDALLMRKICKNPNGLFWAGDTAQTISAGSSFRFEALKAFMYRQEALNSNASQARLLPDFQLAANFRSHGGIVNAAHSIVKLITRFWPQAIDSLSEERAEVDGARPIFFIGWDQDTVQYEQFLFGASGSQIEFGANQCILVRNDAAKEELQKQVGDIGTVMTLYESKGLEFNDVLLYNFFEDSTVDVGQWRVILNALSDRDGIKCPPFDEIRHSGVCRELKFLYVAITRARQNLWIADCSDRGEPLRMFWAAQGLVETMAAIDSAPQLANSSKPEEWVEMARTLFDHKNYSQASRAFARAKMPRQRDIAGAYHLRELARRTSRANNASTVLGPREQAFLMAAQAFSLCADVSRSKKERLAYYRIAAECYLEALELKKAAEAYILIEEHTKAAQIYRQGGLFDEAIDTIERYSEQIQPSDADKIRDVAKIHYSKEQDLDRVTSLFPGVDEALEFMDDFGFLVARVTLLERYGRLREAAEIHLAEGRVLVAIRLLLRSPYSKESLTCLEHCFMKGIRQQLSFGMPLEGDSVRSQLQELLLLGREAATYWTFSTRILDEFALCQAVLDKHTTELRRLADSFVSDHNDFETMMLCLDSVSRTWTELEKASADIIMASLRSFSTFTHELQRMSMEKNPSDHIILQRLFGFHPAPDAEHMIIIPAGTLLHQYISAPENHWAHSVTSTSEAGFTVTPSVLSNVFCAAIEAYLHNKVWGFNAVCLRAVAFSICPVFMLLGERETKHRCNSSHDPQGMTLASRYSRFRLLMQQISTYQWASVFEWGGERARQRRRWLSRLYEAYFPVYSKAGSALDIDQTAIPETERSMQVITEWIRDLLFNENFYRIGRPGFLTFISQVATLALKFEKGGALEYFRRAPCITKDRPEGYFRNDGMYIVRDLLGFLSLRNTTAMSSGVLFIKTVLDRRLPIDANVLCHMVELICAAYAIRHRLRVSGSLHDITLSRKLLARLYADTQLKEQRNDTLGTFVNLLPTLLWEMYSGSSDFLLYESFPKIYFQIRNLFVMRICKAFTLLGHNINDSRLQSMIVQKMASFKANDARANATYSSIFSHYINSTSWQNLIHALRNTGAFEKNTPEELIHLHEARRLQGNLRPIYGTRSVVYQQLGDIPALLRGTDLSGLRDTSVPTPVSIGQSGSGLNGSQLPMEAEPIKQETAIVATAEDEGEQEDSGIDNGAEPGAEEKGADIKHEQHVSNAPTEHEIEAATLLAKAYRRRLSRKQSAEKGVAAELYRLYESYQKSPLLEGLSGRYRMLFLGPIPLAFFSLRTMTTYAAGMKAQARLRMSLVSHAEYDRVWAQMNQATAIIRRVQHLKQQLDPNSKFHDEQSEPELKVLVQEMEKIAEEFPRLAAGVEWELRTAVKGIVQDPSPKKPVVPTKVEKPELVNDIDDYEYY